MKIEQKVEIGASVAKVWDAIADHNKFGQWFRCKLDQPFKEGRPSTGMMTYPGAEHVEWLARIERIEDGKCLEFSWPPYIDDESVDLSSEPWLSCKFELEEVESGTLLTITESGFEKLSPDISEKARQGNKQGWEIQAVHISDYLELGSE